MDVRKFKNLPLMGILRGVESDMIGLLTEAIVSSGLENVEITMNTAEAPDLIRHMVKTANKRFSVGAGTVLSMDDTERALGAGATFIVMPVLVTDVVEYCTKKSIPVFPGALTPQEIYNSWNAGATMVKVFPAKVFGHSYFKEIKGPFQDIQLLACGGVTPENIQSFFSCGAAGVAFGGSVFRQEWLMSGDFSSISSNIKALIDGFKSLNR